MRLDEISHSYMYVQYFDHYFQNSRCHNNSSFLRRIVYLSKK